MTAKDWLILLCRKKQDMLGKKYDYFNSEDLQDLSRWSEEDCTTVKNSILNLVKDHFNPYTESCNKLYDGIFCPWCRKGYDGCDECSYGERHGVCPNDHSGWSKIIKDMGYICRQPEFKKEILSWMLNKRR